MSSYDLESSWRDLSAQMTEVFDHADKIIDSISTDASVDVVAQGLLVLWKAKRDLAEVYLSLEHRFADLMGDAPEVSMPEALIEKRMSAGRKAWQHKELGQEVAARLYQLSVDMETGEILKDPQTLMLEMLDYAAPSYWRVKALERIGVDPDDFCETDDPKPSIRIKPNN